MSEIELNKIIEALLFVSEKPLTVKQIQEVCQDVNAGQIKKSVGQLKESYNTPERGIQIAEVAGGYQFCSHPDCEPYLSKLYKTKKVFRLSAPALETLAIIAYKQPVTKAEMEFIRGVNVDGVVKNLEDRELIRISGRKEVPGRPILYGTSEKFLHYFGLKSLEDLPSLEEFAAQALEKEAKFDEYPQDVETQDIAENNSDAEISIVKKNPDEQISFDEQSDSDDSQLQTGETDNEQDEHTEIAKSN